MNLTNQQLIASRNIHRSMAVIAGAGTGKTKVLTERIKNIAGDDGQALSNILAITFTDKAAKEIISRLYKSFKPAIRLNLANATIGTFHSFCLKLLTNYNKGGFEITGEASSALINKRIASKAIADEIETGNEDAILLLDDLGWFHLTLLIQQMLDFRWHTSNQRTHSSINLNEKMANGAYSIFKRASDYLLKYYNENAFTDFQQLEIDALSLLKDKNIQLECQNRYKHILVDECQDTNDIQIELLERIFNPKKNILFIVGDPKQSIYRFRGANPLGFSKILKVITDSGGESIELGQNFRSSSNIISFINEASKTLISKQLYQELETANDPSNYGVRVINIQGNNLSSDDIRSIEADSISKLVLELISKGTNPEEIVLLFRSINSASTYLDALKQKGIPCKICQNKSFIQEDEISCIMSFLKWCEYDDEISKIAVIRSMLVSATDEDLLTKDYQRLDIYKNILELKNRSKEYTPSDLIEELLKITGLRRIVSEIDKSGTKLGNIEHLNEIAHSLPYPQNLSDLLDAVIELKNKSIRWGEPPSGSHQNFVSLLTAHGAKGLEWEVVILPDLIRKKPPKNNPWIFSLHKGLAFKPYDGDERKVSEEYNSIEEFEDEEQLNEEKRLIYVALTRAKKAIFIPNVENSKTAGLWDSLIKPIIKNCDSHETKKLEFIKYDFKLTDEKYHEINFKPSMLTVSQLEAFDRCPHEFYLRYFKPSANTTFKQSKSIPAHIKGRIIHSYIHKLCQKMDHESAIKYASLEEGITDFSILSKFALSIKNNIKKLLPNSNLSDGYHELPFQWNFDGTVISGIVDWLKPTSQSYEIVDFKTDDIKPSEIVSKSKSYELQLMIYAIATKAGGMNIEGTKLLFVTPSKMVEHKFTAEQEQKTIKNLTNIIENIKKRTFDKIKSDKCENCPFGRTCKTS